MRYESPVIRVVFDVVFVIGGYGMSTSCDARVIGQEYHCGRCGYVWDLNDPEPPTCKTRREIAAQHIAKLKEQLK